MLEGIYFDPPFPAAAIIGLGVLIATAVVISYVRSSVQMSRTRRYVLLGMRLAAVTAIVGILLRPMKDLPAPDDGQRPDFSVVIDVSESMNTEDAEEGSRLNSVKHAMSSARSLFTDDLAERYNVQYYTFGDDLNPSSLFQIIEESSANERMTDIGAALTSTGAPTEKRKLGGILLISDGRENAGGAVLQAARYLKTLQVPVWTVPVGTATEVKDAYLTARLAQNFLYVDQPGKLRVRIAQTGFDGWYAKVNLYREDEYVETRQEMLSGGGVTIEFPLEEAQKGMVRYAVELEPLNGENDETNNRRTLFARVVDEKSKILFLEARPGWDSKFLLRVLQRDPYVQVTSIFRVTDEKVFTVAEKATDDPLVKATVDTVTMPQTRDELFEYDCIILGQQADTLFSAELMPVLKDYVSDRGGSIVLARGRSFAEDNEVFATLAPVVWDDDVLKGLRFELTSEGRVSPIFSLGEQTPADVVLRELPEMLSIARVQQEKSLAVVLARTPTGEAGSEIATVAYQRYGKGKVMSIGGSGLWRWSFMPPNLAEYDEVFARFWTQMIRWLISESDFLPGQEISFRSDQYAYNLGEQTRFTVRTKFVDDNAFQPAIEIRSPSGATSHLTPSLSEGEAGLLTATTTPEEEGEYEAILTYSAGEERTERIRFTVYSDSVEKRFVAADEDTMRQIASITGGECLSLEQLQDLAGKVKDYEQLTREKAKPEDVWDTLTVFSAILAFLALEWFVRRRSGLV
ncbi:MAG: hypothetical protein AMXMBFR84_29840 [Candidatus Hydrogenedentota bacterium]